MTTGSKKAVSKKSSTRKARSKKSLTRKKAPTKASSDKKVPTKKGSKAKPSKKTTAKKVAVKTSAARSTAVAKKRSPAKGRTARPSVSADERWRMIAEAAYLRAERRGFVPGRDLDDWLVAEQEIEARFGAGRQA